MSEKPRRKHSAVIKNQNISGTKMLGEISESIISERASPAVQDKHPRSRPIRERLLRNEFFGKMKIEIGDEHVSTILRATVNLFTTETRKIFRASVAKWVYTNSLTRSSTMFSQAILLRLGSPRISDWANFAACSAFTLPG